MYSLLKKTGTAFLIGAALVGGIVYAATIPPGCSTPGPCADLLPSVQRLITKTFLQFDDSDGSNSISLRAPATVPSNVTLTLPSTLGQSGQVLTTDTGGTLSWSTTNGSIPGDIKSGIQTTDHGGWIKLDGRAVSTLTPTQQLAATALGIGANLPNADNSYLAQIGGTLGTNSGSNTKSIARNQLPNVTLGTTTNGFHSHGHNAGGSPGQYGLIYRSDGGNNTVATTDTTYGEPNLVVGPSGLSIFGDGSHSHTTDSINGGVTQAGFDVRPQTLSVNMFIYLGN